MSSDGIHVIILFLWRDYRNSKRLNLTEQKCFPMCCLLKSFSGPLWSLGHAWLWPIQSPLARVDLRAVITLILSVNSVRVTHNHWNHLQSKCLYQAQPFPFHLSPSPTRVPGTWWSSVMCGTRKRGSVWWAKWPGRASL